ncbi:CrcB family protein [Plantibacter flavus]
MVAVGGALGTAAREAISLATPTVGGVPVAILCINVAGAFLLGVLLESLLLRGPDEGRRRSLRLFLGTGILGGFTTYSALASDSGVLLLGGAAPTGIAYALGTVVLGGLASWLGIIAARRLRPRPGAVDPDLPVEGGDAP